LLRCRISAKNCWFIQEKGYLSDGTGEYIPDRSLELNFVSEGRKYSVLLKKDDGGVWHGDYAVNGIRRAISGKLYKAEDDSMVLIGKWPESGFDYTWIMDNIVIDEEQDV
jgi:hypothetical protein